MISPLFRARAAATDLFDEHRFQIYAGSLIGRRVVVGLTATF